MFPILKKTRHFYAVLEDWQSVSFSKTGNPSRVCGILCHTTVIIAHMLIALHAAHMTEAMSIGKLSS